MLNNIKPHIIFFIVLFWGYVYFLKAQVFLGDLTSYQVSDNSITINAGTSSVNLVFYRDDIVKVEFLPTPNTWIDSSIVVVRNPVDNKLFQVNETASTIEIHTSELVIYCQKKPVRFTFYTNTSKLLLKEPLSGGLGSTSEKCFLNFEISADHHFFGTGARGFSLDLARTSFQSYNSQNYGYHAAPLTMNINIPFVVTPNGFALYIENTYPGYFDFGANSPDIFSYQAAGGELSYFVIVGNTIPSLLKKYTWLTGNQPLPPRWALGYIQSKYGYRNETEAREMVQTMRSKNIPCDAIVLDLYWFDQMGDLSWDYANFPQPFTMMSDFLGQGVKTVVITEPYVVQYSQNFQEATAKGYLGTHPFGYTYLLENWWSCGCNAGLIDMTNPDAREWWWSKHPSFFGEELAGIWTDLGEPERHPYDMVHFMGSTPKIHNIYNLLWAKTIYDGYSEFRPNQRLFNLTRSGYAGIQRYGVLTWSGDVSASFEAMAIQIPMMLNMGMSGLAYHHSDIGGFCCGTTSPELYVRWMQLGAFSPIMRAHGVDYQPQEPWGYGLIVENICKKLIQLRYQLLPYNYTMAYENHRDGIPIARPLLFDEPFNVSFYDEAETYFWGNEILVAPVLVEGTISREVNLPAGQWIDFWTNELFDGAQKINVSTPIDYLPLFIRAGSIIPMQPVMNYTDEFPLDTLILAVYPSQTEATSFTLYEDDGKTLAYQNGAFATTTFNQYFTPSNDNLALHIEIGSTSGSYEGKPAYRTYRSQVHRVNHKPAAVYVNNVEITERLSYKQLTKNATGYFYNDVEKQLYVQNLASADSLYEIVIENIQPASIDLQVQHLSSYQLMQNYPNPFNAKTIIKYYIPQNEFVTLAVFDILGQRLEILVSGEKQCGMHTIAYDGSKLPAGVYFYRMQAGSFTEVKKFLLLK